MNKKVVKKVSSILIVIIMCMIPLALTGSAFAAVNIQDLNHQINIPINKTWTINLNNKLHPNLINNLSNYVKVVTPNGGYLNVGLSYNDTNKAIKIAPPSGGYSTSTTYSIIVKDGLYDSEGKNLEAATVKEFSTTNSAESINNSLWTINDSTQTSFTLSQAVDKQLANSPMFIRSFGYNTSAERTDILQYMNPDRFKNDPYGIYQFMKLNYVEGITADNLNVSLSGAGVLNGKGQAFLDACKLYNISPAYLVAHAILETGHGTSELSKGVKYNNKIVYNFFGIGAIDSDPNGLGAKTAYDAGWFSPEAAIKGGAEWIAGRYINASTKQNTLYKMRWNMDQYGTPYHQYATDVPWAYKQIKYIKQVLDKCPSARLEFEIPVYK
ncbi:N-acetylglucosaminidase [Clostridium sp.]|uniref:N-acetylglucosaminidase n=1 Tax=Clostridium sp. TaxID=1506 RepID=UPI0034638805